ncbi:hypothetical protein [Paenibacillus sp. HW567]|uniref:hypothetical protein n=1 Tax=Paenibacillus sp. HW567 TaxID=1034769 RepID=UPI0003625BC1|nr:hypothetical protein [Paenibacillus sp. HW567]
MKKLIITSVSVVTLLSFIVGCKENPNSNEATNNSHIPIVEQKTTPSITPSTSISPGTDKEALEVGNINSIIPAGWHILELIKGEPVIAEGDLNKDSIPDIATVIEKNVVDQTASPRSLLIAFGGKNDTYSISIIADNVILKADEGGVWGDPFDSLIIDRGSVLVSDYGGSNWRWYNKYRFRYQDNDWFLIGATMGSYFTGTTTIDKSDEDDINLLTGEFIQRRTDEKGNTTTKKGNRGKKELIRLQEFELENM